MTADTKTLTVSIVGKDYQVACPAGEEECYAKLPIICIR